MSECRAIVRPRRFIGTIPKEVGEMVGRLPATRNGIELYRKPDRARRVRYQEVDRERPAVVDIDDEGIRHADGRIVIVSDRKSDMGSRVLIRSGHRIRGGGGRIPFAVGRADVSEIELVSCGDRFPRPRLCRQVTQWTPTKLIT